MNKRFYNSKLTFITKDKLDIPLPEYFVPFYGEIDKVVHGIKMYEYTKDEFFNGHLIVNDFDKYNEINSKYDIKGVTERWLEPKRCLFYNVDHNDIEMNCSIDEGVGLCSSFALPFYGYAKNSNNKTYGNLIRHRIAISNFGYLPELNAI